LLELESVVLYSGSESANMDRVTVIWKSVCTSTVYTAHVCTLTIQLAVCVAATGTCDIAHNCIIFIFLFFLYVLLYHTGQVKEKQYYKVSFAIKVTGLFL
jgi:hypothetical protein